MKYGVTCSVHIHPNGTKLPPTKDALRQHVVGAVGAVGAVYQAAILRRSLVCDPNFSSRSMHGWILKESQLSIDWMSQYPAPHEISKV